MHNARELSTHLLHNLYLASVAQALIAKEGVLGPTTRKLDDVSQESKVVCIAPEPRGNHSVPLSDQVLQMIVRRRVVHGYVASKLAPKP